MDAMWSMERTHRMMERFGGERRHRNLIEMIGGEPAIYKTSFDGDFMRVVDHEFLRPGLAGPIDRLIFTREYWLDRLPLQSATRTHNILVALENLERMIGALRNRALRCRGTNYVVHRVADIVAGTTQQIANMHFKIDGVSEDEIFAKGGLQINDLLLSAGCALKAA